MLALMARTREDCEQHACVGAGVFVFATCDCTEHWVHVDEDFDEETSECVAHHSLALWVRECHATKDLVAMFRAAEEFEHAFPADSVTVFVHESIVQGSSHALFGVFFDKKYVGYRPCDKYAAPGPVAQVTCPRLSRGERRIRNDIKALKYDTEN